MAEAPGSTNKPEVVASKDEVHTSVRQIKIMLLPPRKNNSLEPHCSTMFYLTLIIVLHPNGIEAV